MSRDRTLAALAQRACRRPVLAALLVTTATSAWACGEAASDALAPALAQEVAPASARDHAVGTVRIELTIGAGRTLPVQLWYPAIESARAEAEGGHPLPELEPPGARRDTLTALLARNPHQPGTARSFHAALGAPAADLERFPLIVFSHCLDGTRYATLSVTEHLARLGFVVAAPDHQGGTMYDKLEGRSVGFSDAFLDTRVSDLRGVLDVLLSAASEVVPSGLRGKIDPERVAAFGHSYGGLTTGRVLQDDPRVRSAVFLAVPSSATPLLSIVVARSARIENLTKPGMYIYGTEDLGLYTTAIEDNYKNYPGEVWKVALRDASHFSFVDICGIVPDMAMGCGAGIRNTIPLAPFTPLDPDVVRGQTKQYVGAFFLQTVFGEGNGPADVPSHPAATVAHRPARAE